MTTYVFPGQGAQKLGMGKDLFDKYAEQVAAADEILGYSLSELCLQDPDKKLNLTQYTQPALYAVSALTFLDKMAADEPAPQYVAGHSLGEYSALFAAGVFDFETGLKLVQKRGALMAQAGVGGMAAVMNISLDEIRAILADNGLTSIDIANFNALSQIVISGPKGDIENASDVFEAAGARYVVLKVTSAFHSRYMADSKNEFATFLDNFSFNTPTVPVISNVEARPHVDKGIKHLLAEQITSSVNWVDSIRYLMGKGQEKFVECGPGRVLTGLIRKIVREAEPLVVEETPQAKSAQKPEPQAPMAAPPQAPMAAPSQAPTAAPPQAPMAAPSQAPTAAPLKRQLQGPGAALGSQQFRQDYGVSYACMAASIDQGITSAKLVIAMGQAGLMGYFGSGGQSLSQVESAIGQIQAGLPQGPYGFSLTSQLSNAKLEEDLAELFIRRGITNLEAANYLQITPALVLFRLKGVHRNGQGQVQSQRRIMARVSRPEVAELFMSPAPERVVNRLVEAGRLTVEEASLGRQIPMSDDICVVADCGGPSDQGVAYALMPAILSLRATCMSRFGYGQAIRVGAAGGIGTPEAAAAAFVLGAEFILTGSVNQCTVEAGTSEAVKDLLAQINVQDTAYAPAGEMFEMGARIQVLKRGLFFPARANKLYTLYQQYGSLEELDQKTASQIQDKYFRKSFQEVWSLLERTGRPEDIEKGRRNPKHKMLLVFKWYFGEGWRLAQEGDPSRKVDYQVYCGPAMGAFNQWVTGTPMEANWRNRHAAAINTHLMDETMRLLKQRLGALGAVNH